MPPIGGYHRSNGVAVYDDEFRGYRLFIGNIAPGVTEHDVCKYFGQFGEVKMVWLARDPPGFAYVVYFDRHVAEAARHKTHMCRWFNRLIKVEFAVPRRQNSRRGNFASGSGNRRSRSQDNHSRFRSRGVRINRSRSPVNSARSGRRGSEQRNDTRVSSRGMFPPPPRIGGVCNIGDQRRAAPRSRHDNDDGDRRGDSRTVSVGRWPENVRPASGRDSSRRYLTSDDDTLGRVNSRRNDADSAVNGKRDHKGNTVSRSRITDEGNLKRMRSRTLEEPLDDEMQRPRRRPAGADVGDKRVRNDSKAAEGDNGNYSSPPPSRSNVVVEEKNSGGKGSGRAGRSSEVFIDRSPGEVQDDNDVGSANKRYSSRSGRKRREATPSPVHADGVSRTTTRYRSPPDADNDNNAGDNIIVPVRKPLPQVREDSADDDIVGRRYAAAVGPVKDMERNRSPGELSQPETGRRYFSRSNSAHDDDDVEDRAQRQRSHTQQAEAHENADYEELDEDDADQWAVTAAERPESGQSDRQEVKNGRQDNGHENGKSPRSNQYAGKAASTKHRSRSPLPELARDRRRHGHHAADSDLETNETDNAISERNKDRNSYRTAVRAADAGVVSSNSRRRGD